MHGRVYFNVSLWQMMGHEAVTVCWRRIADTTLSRLFSSIAAYYWSRDCLSLALSLSCSHTHRRDGCRRRLDLSLLEKPSQSTEDSEANEGSSFSQQTATWNEAFRSATNVLCFFVSAACLGFHCQSLRRKIIKNVIMAMQLKALKLLDSARLTRLCTPTAITIVSARFVSLFYYFILRVHSCLATSQKLKQ